MLNILTAGLPVTAKELLSTASSQVFGDNGAEIIELTDGNLRQRVRLSGRNPSDVLVVLDSVSANKCKSIENGLYATDKYHEYSDDKNLVQFLNSKYELSIEYKDSPTMEVSSEVNREAEEIIERLQTKLSDKEAIIRNLNARNKELSAIIENGEFADVSTSNLDNEELSSLKDENLQLRDQNSTYISEKSKLEESNSSLKLQVEELQKSVESLKAKQKLVVAEYESVSKQLTDYKVKYSTATGLINSKDSELESLRSQLQVAKEKQVDGQLLLNTKESLEKTVKSLQVENSQLSLDVTSKESEIIRLKEQLSDSGDFGKKLKASETRLTEAQKEVVRLNKELVDLKSSSEGITLEREKFTSKINELQDQNNQLTQTISGLQDKIKAQDASLIEANSELIKAKSTVEMLEKSTNRDTDIEELYKTVSSTQKKYDEISNGVFGRLSNLSSPKQSLNINLLREPCQFKRIRFAFSGSTESRKGTYRSLLEEFRNLPQDDKVVIVDAVAETCVDYVFEIKKIVNGINWFIKGGGVQQYLSQTCLPNVQVLSPGLGYVNDGYFLTVDWNKRLRELEMSGYNVVLYCGDISSLTGRVLHESFANLGASIVYVHGNAIGARTIVANFMGVSNRDASIVCYFDFNPKMKKFYDMVAEKNECRIISAIK